MEAIVKPKNPTNKIRLVSKLSETIRKPNENICIRVFHFERFVTKSVSVE